MSPLFCPIFSAAKKTPRKSALLAENSSFTYEQLEEKIQTYATFLQESKKNTFSIYPVVPSFSFFAFLFACFREGKKLFLPNHYYPEPILQTWENKIGAFRVDPVLIIEKKKSFSSFSLEKARLILMSSGSTKEPKFLSLPFASLFYNAISCVETLRLQEGDLYLLSLPLFHVSGLAATIRSFIQKASILFSDKKSFLYNISGHTHVSLVPTQLYRLIQSNSLSSWKKSIKAILVGGAFCPRSLYEKAKQEGLPVFLSYGMSEMGSQVFMTENPYWENELPFLGFGSPKQQILLSTEKELLLQGPSCFEGYLFEESPFTKEGWFPTKDLCLYHPEKGYAILGRKDRMFITGGENIYPEEIEKIAQGIEGVEKVYVTSKKDPERGEVPILYIQTKNKKDSILSYLKERLPSYKIPVEVFPFVPPSGQKDFF